MINIGSSFSDSGYSERYGVSVKEHFYINGFNRKISVYYENENHIVKTASNNDEVMDAIRLRSQVFLEELNNKSILDSLDIDEYDIFSDHLLLIDKEKNEVIGTYRFNSNLYSNAFYSEKEFNIFNILILPGIKLELGRACIHKSYRNGTTLTLLWTGLMQYIKSIRADFLFGCSSFNLPDLKAVAQLHKYFKEFNFIDSEKMTVFPTEKYKIKDLDIFSMEVENSGRKEYLLSQRFIPGLVKGYISAGARICGEPIYDPDFNCYDFFTFLDLKQLDEKYVSQVTLS
jgi:putative hemolysin